VATELPDQSYCAVGSVKTNIGHLESGAGIAGVIKVLLAMKHGILPGNLHFKQLNPQIGFQNSPFYILEQNQEWTRLKNGDQSELLRCAGVSSFGFGGVNAHIVLQEYISDAKPVLPLSGQKWFCPLSARTPERLRVYAASLYKFLLNNPGLSLLQIAYTLQTGREDMEERTGFLVDSTEQLKEALLQYSSQKDSAAGIHSRSTGKAARRLAAVATRVNPREMELKEAVQLWLNGAAIDWKHLYDGLPPRKISLPGYPFGGESYWLPEEHDDARQTLSRSFASMAPSLEEEQPDSRIWLRDLLKRLKNGEISANDVKRRVEANYGEQAQ
jgi:acyl transferase domain-containing protein